MSYILEALRKSEQARQQNTAVRQYSLLPVIGERMMARRHWPYVLAAALLVNAAVFYFWLRATPQGATVAIKGPTVTQAPKGPVEKKADTAPVFPRDKPASAMEITAPDDVVSPRSRSEPAPDSPVARIPASAQALPQKAPGEFEKRSKPVAVHAVPGPNAKSGPSAQTAVAADAKPAAAVAAAQQKEQGGTGELPPSLRKELPPLSVTGIIREQGSGGMAIVNDKTVREGDEVAPGLKLEKIQDDSLVFSYKGYRFVQ